MRAIATPIAVRRHSMIVNHAIDILLFPLVSGPQPHHQEGKLAFASHIYIIQAALQMGKSKKIWSRRIEFVTIQRKIAILASEGKNLLTLTYFLIEYIIGLFYA